MVTQQHSSKLIMKKKNKLKQNAINHTKEIVSLFEVKKEDSTTVTSTNNFDTLKSNIEEMVKNKTSSGQHSIQNDKLNQLKQKLTTLNKVSSIGMMNKNQDEAMKTKQHKSFNQIQKKWKDVFSRTQRNNTSTKDK